MNIHGHVDGDSSDCAYREVQLKSPNWLYGQRKPEDSGPANVDSPISVKPLATKKEKNEQEFENLDWLTTLCPYSEEELFTRYKCFSLRILPGPRLNLISRKSMQKVLPPEVHLDFRGYKRD